MLDRGDSGVPFFGGMSNSIWGHLRTCLHASADASEKAKAHTSSRNEGRRAPPPKRARTEPAAVLPIAVSTASGAEPAML